MAGTLRLFVEDRVQGWVVIHLHLAVELESSVAGEHLLPESAEARGEIVALLVEDGQTGVVALPMRLGGSAALGLFGGVVELQREDRETVEHEAGSFGVERRAAVLRGRRLG